MSESQQHQAQLKLAKQITQRIPGVFLIANVILLVVLAIVDPRGFFVASVPFSLFNLYLLTKIGYWSTKGLNRFKKAEGKDYYKKYLEKKQSTPHLAKWEDVVHYVIIPNYKESEGTLQEMLNSLAMSKVAKTHMIPVLAMEEREEGAADKAKTLIKNNKELFKDVMYTLHPPTIPNELKGKSSNEAWAAQKVFEDVKKKEMDRDNALITICDADSNLHVKHFDALTYKFCKDPNRHVKIFQGPMVCYKNYHTTPVPTRILSMAVSLHEIAALQDPFDVHIPFSTYSLSCTLAQNTGGWDGDVIAEDWHMFIKSFFNSGGRVTVESLPFPVLCYAVEADSWWGSVKARYDQGMRHCWGINELGYLFYKAYEGFFVAPKSKRPNPLKTLLLSLKACSLHYLNAMGLIHIALSMIVIGAYTYIPALAATEKAAAVTGKWSLIFKVANMLTLPPTLVTLFSHVRLVQYSVGAAVYGKMIWLRAIQWGVELALFQAPVALIFGCWPTFYSAIKQFFTDKLDYVVAAKPTVNAVSMKESVAIDVAEEKDGSSDELEREESQSEHQPLVTRPLVTV